MWKSERVEYFPNALYTPQRICTVWSEDRTRGGAQQRVSDDVWSDDTTKP